MVGFLVGFLVVGLAVTGFLDVGLNVGGIENVGCNVGELVKPRFSGKLQ
jgi:hypothetical protein